MSDKDDLQIRQRLNLYKQAEKLVESPRSQLGYIMEQCGLSEFQQLYLMESMANSSMFIVEAPIIEATLDQVVIRGNKIAVGLTPDMLGEIAEWNGECCETEAIHRLSVTQTLMSEGVKQWAIALAGQLVGHRYPDGIKIDQGEVEDGQ